MGIPLILLGPAIIAPTANKMAGASTKDEVTSLAGRIGIYGRIEAGLVIVLLALMVAMHAGY